MEAIVTTVASGIGTVTADVRDRPTIVATDEEKETPMPILLAEATETGSARTDTLDGIAEVIGSGIATVARRDEMRDATMMTGSREGRETLTMTADVVEGGTDAMKVSQDRKVAVPRRRRPRSESQLQT